MHAIRLTFLLLLTASCTGARRGTSGPATPALVSVGTHPAALAVLDAAASEPEPGVRAAALAARIRTSAEPAGGPWGPRAVFDPSPWVRRAGAAALADRLPEEAAAAALRGLVGRSDADAYTRCGAAMHLARAGDATALSAVQAAIDAASGGWEVAPCALAAASMGSPAAVPALEAALEEGELPLELGFVADLASSGLVAVAPAVGTAVGLVEEPLRIPLAGAWMELGGAGGAAVLRTAITEGTVEEQMTALDQVVDSDAPAADDLLQRAAAADGPVRAYARLVLAARSGELGPAVAAAEDADDRDARALAMDAAGLLVARLDDPGARVARKARALLVVGLQDPDDAVRLAAVRSLSRVGTAAEAAALEPLLEAEGATLRVAAAAALLQLGGDPGPGAGGAG